jgi:hypothetical protein
MQSSVEQFNELKNLPPTFLDNIKKTEFPKHNLFQELNKNLYSPSQVLKISKIDLDANIKSHKDIAK